MANEDRILDFVEFVRQKNSFGLHFVGPVGNHLFGDIYRSQAHYVRCMAANPRFAELATELLEMKIDESPEYLPKLYEAYKCMHPYAKTNWEMFA